VSGESDRARIYRSILAQVGLGDVRLEFVDRIADLSGAGRFCSGQCYIDRLGVTVIELKAGMAEALANATFAHEVAHALRGDPAALKAGASRRQVEIDADEYGERLLRRWHELEAFYPEGD
jgi:hypothetical protein